jgi:hypothetical protein
MGYCKADLAAAKQHEKDSLLLDKNGNLRSILWTSVMQIGEHGTGLMLYLMFLKWMGIAFFIISVLSIPCLVSNIVGNGTDDNTKSSFLDKTTLGN